MTAAQPLLLVRPLLPTLELSGDWRHEASLDHDDPYDLLLDGLRSGRFGGVPCDTAAAAAMVETLRLTGWPINFRAFAGAIAHYPEVFGLSEARTSLRILGLWSETDRVKGAHLAALPVGSFIVTTDNRCLFVQTNDQRKLVLFDPTTFTTQRIRRRKVYDCIVITPADEVQGSPAGRNGWIGTTMARFGPENRTILALTFLSNMLVILASLSVGVIFDKVLPAKASDTLALLLIGIGLLLFFDLWLRRMKARIIARVSGRLEYIVSSALYEKLLSFRLEMLQASAVSEQINRLKQFETVRDFYSGPIVAVLFEMPFVILMLIAIGVLNFQIALLLMCVLAVYLVIALVLYPSITRNSKEMMGLRAECMRLKEETVNQRMQIVQRGLGGAWSARLTPRFRKLSIARQRVESVWRTLNNLIAVVSPLASGGVIVVGAMQVMEGNMTGGTLIACMILASRLLSPVQQALVLAVRAPEISNLFKQIDAMMQIPNGQPARPINAAQYLQADSAAPTITIDGLVIRYPRSVAPALKGVTLNLEGGTLTCLTGPSGAGKSSLLSALMGHYKPQSGSVLIGSANVEQFGSSEKTDLIGFLGHKSLQIHGTLTQNLRLTRPDATEEQLHDICAELGLLDQIAALPDGFETRLDQAHRYRISASFRTKFAVAQLLLKQPKVLLLDEPESGLSNDDEDRLMSVLKARADRMTTVMVTHRPSLVQQADRVLVLQDGQVKFFGQPKTKC